MPTWLMDFFGGGAFKAIVDKALGFIPNPEERQKATEALTSQLQSAMIAVTMGQIETNKEEAKSASVFVAGWRPAIGWICAAALGYQYLLRPIATTIMSYSHIPVIDLPGLDDNLWQLLLGMLGLGGLRTYEKVTGVTKGMQ